MMTQLDTHGSRWRAINRLQVSGREQNFNVSRIAVYAAYEQPTVFSNDIALLLFLSHEADLNEDVGIIAIPPQGGNTTGQIVVAGWGTTGTDDYYWLEWG